MAKKHLPDPAILRQHFSYNPETGELRWIKKRKGRPIGEIAGCFATRADGTIRRMVGFDYSIFYDYRIIWAYVTGAWPANQIDHINGDPLDNRWCNLREATASQNQCNKGKTKRNTSGFKGVSWNKGTNKWEATIMLGKKVHYLGGFDSRENARDAYVKACKELHGEFSREH